MINVNIGNFSYIAAKIASGIVYTDRDSNITFSSNRQLVPYVSWQYSEGNVLSDEQNKLLNRTLLPVTHPTTLTKPLVCLITGGGGNYNYYHWLFDVLPRLNICRTLTSRMDDLLFLVPDNSLQFQAETLSMLGITKEQQISSRNMRHIKACCIATSHPNPNANEIPSWIVEFLRNSFLSHSAGQEHPPFVYIERTDSVNERRLLNEKKLIDRLTKVGFKTYRLSELSVASQICLFAKAKIIVGVHGAGLANLAFCSKGCVVYELFTSDYVPQMYKSIAAQNQLIYIGREFPPASSDGVSRHKASFYISNRVIEEIIESAEKFNLV